MEPLEMWTRALTKLRRPLRDVIGKLRQDECILVSSVNRIPSGLGEHVDQVLRSVINFNRGETALVICNINSDVIVTLLHATYDAVSFLTMKVPIVVCGFGVVSVLDFDKLEGASLGGQG